MATTLRRRIIRILLILLLLPPILAGIAGWLVAPGFLHPMRRELTPDLIREADTSFAVTNASVATTMIADIANAANQGRVAVALRSGMSNSSGAV